MTVYRVDTKVSTIEERYKTVRVLKGADNTGIPVKEYLGWFVAFDGSYESLHLGMEKPDLKVGQPVSIMIVPK